LSRHAEQVKAFTSEQEPTAVHVAKGASYIFLQGIATNIMMTITFAIIARIITTAEMGAIAVLTMVTGACQLTANIGMSSGVTKFMAESLARNDRKSAAGAFYQAFRTSAALSILLALALFATSQFLSEYLLGAPDQTVLFQLSAASIVATAGFLPILNSAMLGLQRIREMAIIGTLYSVMRQALIVSLVFLTHSLRGLVVAWIISGTLASVILLTYVVSKLGPPSFSFDPRHLIRFSTPLFLQDIVNFTYSWFDRAILLAYTSLATLGIYSAAMTAFGVLAGVPSSIGTALLPAYSSLQGRRGARSLEGSIKTASRYICYIGTPLAFGLLATSKPALTLFVGEAYADGALPLMALSFFLAVTIISTSFSGVLVALEETTLSLKLTILSVAVGITSALLLLPPLDALGAALTRGLAMVVSLVATVASLKRKIKLTFDKEAFTKSLTASLTMALIVVLAQSLQYSKYLLPVYVLVGAATYLTMLRILHAIKPADIELIKQYLGPRFHFTINKLARYLISQKVQHD
jgi:O-antigen/teichoic acid export membrane protein